jgi:hypothetical protein
MKQMGVLNPLPLHCTKIPRLKENKDLMKKQIMIPLLFGEIYGGTKINITYFSFFILSIFTSLKMRKIIKTTVTALPER